MLDLGLEASRSVMSSRAVSDDPRQVIVYAREFLGGLRDSGVLGCGKHFPGLGEGKLDSHHDLPVIEKPLKKMWVEDLFPYRILRHQLPFVMVSHAAYPEVTGERTPASLSKRWMTDILRKRIRYNGFIVSDDMEMGAVLEFAPIEQTVVQHIRGGGDMVLVCHKEEMIVRAFEALIHETERDRKFARQVAKTVKRGSSLRMKLFGGLRMQKTRSRNSLKTEFLSRQLWEFGEEIRIETLARSRGNRA